jgi:cytochrome b561
MRPVSRYHPLLAALHWVLAVLIIGALSIGFFSLAQTPNTDPQKVGVLELHMAGGLLILALMVVRLVVRLRTSKPGEATIGYRLADRLAPISHYGFYVLVILMVVTGYATGIIAGLPAIVFQRSGAPLPATFDVYPTFVAHALLATALAILVVLHVLAALYHQLVRRDGLFRRMAFGRRLEEMN